MKRLIKSAIRGVGFDLRRYHPATSEDAQFAAMLSAHGVNMIFDVGANTGQFGQFLRDAGYRGGIVSFEPLSSARKDLAQAVAGDPLWTMAEAAALGASTGFADLHVSGNSVSSSILPMLDRHSRSAPESAYVGTERVPLKRLDDVAGSYLRPDSKLFLKLDTQGYEDQVMQGAPDTLHRALGLRIELSFVPLYEGQLLYKDMLAKLEALGFEMWNLTPAFIDPASGRLLQVDGVFFRS